MLPLKAQSLREVEGDLARDVGWLTTYFANETKGLTRYTYVDICNVFVGHVVLSDGNVELACGLQLLIFLCKYG